MDACKCGWLASPNAQLRYSRNRQMRTVLLIVSLILNDAATHAQPPEKLTFEVASVKPAPQSRFFGQPRGGPGTHDPSQITWTDASLQNVLIAAYDVQNFQITAPDWMFTEKYEIVAKVAPGTTREQVRIMWQSLLAERFGLVVHHAPKQFQVELLTVAKGGLKMKETDLAPGADPFTPVTGPPKLDKNGMPELNGTGAIVVITLGPPLGRITARGLTAAEIAARLGGIRGAARFPVIDKTGLTGRYDFTLEFAPDLSALALPPGAAGPADSASDPAPGIESAVEKQLGLKLTPGKEILDVIVVDHAEKVPTAN